MSARRRRPAPGGSKKPSWGAGGATPGQTTALATAGSPVRAKALGTSGGRAARGRLEQAYSRLQHLYEVSRVLTRFGEVEATLLGILEIVREALSLRSAIFFLESERSPKTIVWHADGVNASSLQASQAHARSSYAYLVGATRAARSEATDATGKSWRTGEDLERAPPILLPLAVGNRGIFGALQLESTGRFEEHDVMFINAIVNLLAVALDRRAAIAHHQVMLEEERLGADERQASADARQARAEREEREANEQRLRFEQQRLAVEAERAAAERKWAVAVALRERHEALVDNLDRAFLWEADPETYRVTYVSARAEGLLGFARQRWVDEDDFWMRCVHSEDRRLLVEIFVAALLEKEDKRCDHRCVAADGRVLWFHTGVHVTTENGAPRLQGVSLDITATKEAERKLRGQLGFTRAVTDSLGEGVIAVDLKGRITLFNPAAARMLGTASEEAIGQPVERVMEFRKMDGSVIQQESSPFGHAMHSGEPSRGDDWCFVGKDGEAFPVSHISAPLRREGGGVSGAVLAFDDIRQRVQTERAVEQAQRAAHDREDLLAVVSHDLKNPLSVILMTAASMARRFDSPESERAEEQLQAILRSAVRMNRLVQDLLDVASVEAGRLAVEPQPSSVSSLVGEAIEAIKPLAASKPLRLVSALPAKLPLVNVDPSRFLQVLGNLLGNALKFTPPGGCVTVRAEPRGAFVRFAVLDTGPGIPEEDLPHLFERFWQARTTARLGAGLGLSIVKGIVLAHGGEVWATSTVGAGSTLFFTLPAV